MVRYGDDFTAAFKYHKDASNFKKILPLRMKSLILSLQKTKHGNSDLTVFVKKNSGNELLRQELMMCGYYVRGAHKSYQLLTNEQYQYHSIQNARFYS